MIKDFKKLVLGANGNYLVYEFRGSFYGSESVWDLLIDGSLAHTAVIDDIKPDRITRTDVINCFC
jgi:hypothetical protein